MDEIKFYFSYLFCTYFPPHKYELSIFEIYEIASKYFEDFEVLEPNENLALNENLSLYDDICHFLSKREEEIKVDLQLKILNKF